MKGTGAWLAVACAIVLGLGAGAGAEPTAFAAPAAGAGAAAGVALTGSFALAGGGAVWFYGDRTGCGDSAPLASAPPCGSVLLAKGGRGPWRTVLVTRTSTIQGVAFATPAQGYVALSPDACGFGPKPFAHCGGELLATTDGGRAWHRVLGARGDAVADLAAPAPGVAWAWLVPLSASCQAAVHRCPLEIVSRAGPGRPWRVAYRARTAMTVGSAFGSLRVGRRLVGWTYSAAQGRVLVTRDGGRSWQALGRLKTGSATALPAVTTIDFVNPDDGWLTFCNTAAVGNGGCENSLYATRDAGRTWTRALTWYCIDWMAVHMQSARDGTLLTGGQTACQSPSATGLADPMTGTSYDSNAVYRTSDGGRRFRRVAVVGAILGPPTFSARGTWVSADSCAYFAQAGCRSFAARLEADGRLVPVYPGSDLPLAAARAGEGAVAALTMAIPGGPLSVWTRAGPSVGWRRIALRDGPPPDARLVGFGALPGAPGGWWLAATYPHNGDTWLWAKRPGAAVASWRIAPPAGGAPVPFVVAGPRSVWTGAACRDAPGACDASLFDTLDAGRTWSRLAGPAGQVVLSFGLVGGRPVVLSHPADCRYGAWTGRCRPAVERWARGAWRFAALLPAAVGPRLEPELAPTARAVTLGYSQGGVVHVWRLGADGTWSKRLLAANDLAALPFAPGGPGMLLPNVCAVVGAGVAAGRPLTLP